MKRFLSLFLVLAMLLSLCACGGKKESGGDTSGQVNQQVDVDGQDENLDAEGDTSSDPEKVKGDRVSLGGSGPKVLSNDWKVGPVDPFDVINEDRMPVETGVRMNYVIDFSENSTFSMNTVIKGENAIMEFDSQARGMQLLTRFFSVDGESYLYVHSLEDGEINDALYKLVDEDGEAETDASEGVAESFTSSFDTLDLDQMDADAFKSLEYIGNSAGYHRFSAEMKDGSKLKVLIDENSGLVSKFIITVKDESKEQVQSMEVNFMFNIPDDEFIFDVTDAEENSGDIVIGLIFAQMMMLMDVDELGMSDLEFDADFGDVSVTAD